MVLPLLAAGATLLGAYADYDTARQNRNEQRRQFAYQQDLNQLMMDREDNAMQRRVEDLRKAGINPLMAAGGPGASASPMQSAPAPQMRNSWMDKQLAFQTLKKMETDIKQQNQLTKEAVARTALSKQQEKKTLQETINAAKQEMLLNKEYNSYDNKRLESWVRTGTGALQAFGVGIGARELFKGKTRKQIHSESRRKSGEYIRQNRSKNHSETYKEIYYETP